VDRRSPEARARELRYAALERMRAQHGYAHVATAHTLEDQAETVLLRAVRGTALPGLGGVRPVVGRVVGFDEIPEALRDLTERRAVGRIVARVADAA